MLIFRKAIDQFENYDIPVKYIAIGRKGRDLLRRSRKPVVADFSDLPSPPTFLDVSAIGRLAVDEFLAGNADQVYLAFNEYRNMIAQDPIIRKLLPLDIILEGQRTPQDESFNVTHESKSVFIYEPDQVELLSTIVPRFTAMQVFQALLSAQASEHSSRMIAMRNATDNSQELARSLQLEYNKVRQQAITNDLLDIAGGIAALEN